MGLAARKAPDHTAMHDTGWFSSWAPAERPRRAPKAAAAHPQQEHAAHAPQGPQLQQLFAAPGDFPPFSSASWRLLLTQSQSSRHPPRKQAPRTPPTMGPAMDALRATISCGGVGQRIVLCLPWARQYVAG